jgi:hypothetical protein
MTATGRGLAYVYGENDSQGTNPDKTNVDEARKIAAQINRLPELLRRAKRQEITTDSRMSEGLC